MKILNDLNYYMKDKNKIKLYKMIIKSYCFGIIIILF